MKHYESPELTLRRLTALAILTASENEWETPDIPEESGETEITEVQDM